MPLIVKSDDHFELFCYLDRLISKLISNVITDNGIGRRYSRTMVLSGSTRPKPRANVSDKLIN